MVIKINYTSSDVYVSTSVSPVYVVVNYSGTSGGAGTVTSVGLSMPSAFSVANSPITSEGTLEVTGAGTASQYVRGDGQLANFPSNGGGGASFNYYLNGSVAYGTYGGVTYYEMSKNPVFGAGTNFTRTNAQGNGYIASFITDFEDPSLLAIPGGNWNLEFYFSASSGGGNPQFYAELYKVSSSNVFDLVASGSTNPEGITNGTTVDQYFTSIPVPETALSITNRIAIRIYVIPNGRTITLHTEDNNLCEVLTTFSTGISAINGLTAFVQYFATGTSGSDFAISSESNTHTFNLPTASGTNRGLLSSSDWTSFNNKQSALTLTTTGTSGAATLVGATLNIPQYAAGISGSGTTGQVAYWNGTSSQTGSNNLFWDAANARLGIGTNTPASLYKLDVVGAIRASTFLWSPAFYAPSDLFFGISGGTSAMRITTNRNVQIFDGLTPTDGGQRLQVIGDAFIKGSGATSATTGLQIQNSGGSPIFQVRNDSIVIYGGANTGIFPTSDKGQSITNGAGGLYLGYFATGDLGYAEVPSVTIGRPNNRLLNATSGTQIMGSVVGNFSPTSGTGLFRAFEVVPTINQTGGANGITRGLYVNPTLTAAADWRSIEWSNNSGWGLYGAGTANNYLGGSLGVGTTTTTRRLNINQALGGNCAMIGLYASGGSFVSAIGAQATTDNLQFASVAGILFYSGSTIGNVATEPTNERMRLTTAGRLLLGTTTESTFLLDVNGTARVSGAMTISGLITASSGLFVNGILDIYSDGSNGAISMRTLTNTLCLRKYVKVLGDDGGFGNNNASAAFQIDGTNRGFLPPRMTTTQKNAISSPAAGLQVYDTTLNQMSYYNGTTWVNF